MEQMNSRVACKSMHKNPLDKNRSPTDTTSLYIFGFLLVAWFVTNCVYLIRGDFQDSLLSEYMNSVIGQQTKLIEFPKFYYENGVELISWIAIVGNIVLLILFRTLICLPKLWTVIAELVIVVTVGYYLGTNFFIARVMINPANEPYVPLMVWQMLVNFIIAAWKIAGAIACYKAKLSSISNLVKKTSHSIFFFPSFILFGLIIFALILGVIAFTVASLYSMDHFILDLLSLTGGLYVISVISSFTAMVISQSVSTWYWSENREELSGFAILKSIGLIGRNHLGSILFCSTWILPVVLSLYVLCKNKFRAASTSCFVSFWVKVILLFTASDYALIVTASNGFGIHEATKKIFSLFTRNSVIFLSFTFVFNSLLTIFNAITMLIVICSSIAIFPYNPFDDAKDDVQAEVILLYGMGFFFFSAVLAIAYSAAQSVIVNATEEIEENKERDNMTQVGSA